MSSPLSSPHSAYESTDYDDEEEDQLSPEDLLSPSEQALEASLQQQIAEDGDENDEDDEHELDGPFYEEQEEKRRDEKRVRIEEDVRNDVEKQIQLEFPEYKTGQSVLQISDVS